MGVREFFMVIITSTAKVSKVLLKMYDYEIPVVRKYISIHISEIIFTKYTCLVKSTLQQPVWP